jgi:hypothetical protein
VVANPNYTDGVKAKIGAKFIKIRVIDLDPTVRQPRVRSPFLSFYNIYTIKQCLPTNTTYYEI